ncbi:MAG TPA: ATP-grasp domain-containing protein [Kofleriaceae bacterium]
MQIHWLIEVGVFPETASRVCAAIEARGDRWTRYVDGIAEAELPPRDAYVVFWGSLAAAYRDRVAASWRPGAIGDIEQFRVASYAPRLGPLFVNTDAVTTSVRGLVENRRDVLAMLHQPRRVFVRPDSALKPFAGRVLDAAAIDRAALDYGFYYDDDALPIVVAPARQIQREWRVVVAEGRVVTGCAYTAERRGAEEALPVPVREIAREVSNLDWQPAPIYIVDVAEVDHQVRVLELNPFSGADLYRCDPHAVVEVVSRVSERLIA